jgi:hypothetical protein
VTEVADQVEIGTRLLGRAEAGRCADGLTTSPPQEADGTLLAVVPIPGTGTSLAIVGYPVSAPGAAVAAVRLVWRRDFSADSRTVDVHVSRLRHKLGPGYARCLVTEYRVGYQFRPAVSA